jgi:hypothetical protein
MIIATQRKFIYIHIPKTGGTSVKKGLLPYYDRKKELEKIPKNIRRPGAIGKKHSPAIILKNSLGGKIWNSYFKFAFVRNPWDWVVSVYHFMRKNGRDPRQPEVLKKTFEEFVPWFIQQDRKVEFKLLNGQHSYVMHKGKTLVNFLGKLEKLQEHFDIACKRIGIPSQKLGKHNTTVRKAYREYYSKRNRNLIGQFFKEDVRLFNYEF